MYLPLKRSGLVTRAMTAAATSDETGGDSHALDEVGFGHAQVAGVACDGMLAELGIRHDARRQRPEAQAEPETMPDSFWL